MPRQAHYYFIWEKRETKQKSNIKSSSKGKINWKTKIFQIVGTIPKLNIKIVESGKIDIISRKHVFSK
jgi:hypothetical protein